MAASVKRLEAKADRLRAEMDAARRLERDLRRARGPWAATNLKANRKRQVRLRLKLAEVSKELFKAKMAADAAARAN
jgi:hypothetical protein